MTHDHGHAEHDAPHHERSDREQMSHAAAVGRTARLVARPNPWVGAVVVDARGSVVASGATEAVGERHAEVVALDASGHGALGATLYVTLEPCAHTGRTPPCTDRVVASGIARVVVAVLDPDARVQGRGVAALRDAGLVVDVGCLADEVEADLAPYLHHRRTGRPLVVLKWAATMDGRTAAPDGSSRWVTSAAAREDVHRLRADCDAILVGAGTVRRDDPALTVRLSGYDRQPLRVVLGTRARGRQGPSLPRVPRAARRPCSTTSARGACCSCSSKAAPTSRTTSWPAASSTAYVAYLAPRPVRR